MPEISVPWGSEELRLTLPEHWTLQQVARPELRAAPADWADRLAVVLSQPGTGLPLSKLLAARRKGRIAIVVEDITRHSPLPQILAVLMREIEHADIAREQIELVFATGMHPPMTAAQAAEKAGPAMAGIPWRCNPWADRSAYVRVGSSGGPDALIDRGVADADLRILVSSVSPHLQAGFGGGYKMLIPGCAHLDTIRALHRLGIGRAPRQLVGADASVNPMRSAIDAVGQLVDERCGKTFSVQHVLDERDLPGFIAAGEVVPTQRMLAKQCSVACGVLMSCPADVLVANAHPRDFDLWQSFKCIANTRWAARRDGVIICLTRCEAGLNNVRPPRWPISPAWTRRIVRALGSEALGTMLMRLVPRLAGDAAFFVRLALQTIQRNTVFIVSPLLKTSGATFPGIELFGSFEEAADAADRLLGRGPQRVTVFPSGGVTYPVPLSAAAG
jgi:nickel-dependent lactate racemase